MDKNKLYILAFDSVFTWKHLFTKPVKWIIKLFTGSDYNHVAYAYSYADRKQFINQAIGSGYESINYMNCFKKRHSKIFAYEITVPINFELLHKDTIPKIGLPYGAEEAAYSVIDRIPILNYIYRKIFKVSQNDKDLFCSQDVIFELQRQGYLGYIKDSNNINPEECIKLILKYSLCNSNKILVWDKDKIINNIFE